MPGVLDKLLVAMNDHDLDAMIALFHPDYRSEQPAHPGRAFMGSSQVHANWAAMFSGVPDFHAELVRAAQDGETTWTEWIWSGTRGDAVPFDVRGVALFDIREGLIIGATLYLEDREREDIGIAEAVENMSGQRPR
jgi:limonene-1,2-epoxide hydrolase